MGKWNTCGTVVLWPDFTEALPDRYTRKGYKTGCSPTMGRPCGGPLNCQDYRTPPSCTPLLRFTRGCFPGTDLSALLWFPVGFAVYSASVLSSNWRQFCSKEDQKLIQVYNTSRTSRSPRKQLAIFLFRGKEAREQQLLEESVRIFRCWWWTPPVSRKFDSRDPSCTLPPLTLL